MFASALEVFAHAAAPRGKPGFELYETVVDGETVRVAEAIEARRPFGQLKHFKHKGTKDAPKLLIVAQMRSEEHTSELQSLMRISYAVFGLKKKNREQLHRRRIHAAQYVVQRRGHTGHHAVRTYTCS